MKINEICTTGFFQLFLQNMKKMRFLHMCEWKKVQQNEKINGILLQKKYSSGISISGSRK